MVTEEKLSEWLEDKAQVSDKPSQLTSRRKALSWVRFLERGACLMASTFSSVGEIPLAEITQPMYVTNLSMNWHLLRWSCKP